MKPTFISIEIPATIPVRPQDLGSIITALQRMVTEAATPTSDSPEPLLKVWLTKPAAASADLYHYRVEDCRIPAPVCVGTAGNVGQQNNKTVDEKLSVVQDNETSGE